MSRYHSPYAAYHRPSRWPWVMLLLVLVVIAAAGAAAYQGESPTDLLEAAGITSNDPEPTEPAAAAAVTESADQTATSETDAAGPTAPADAATSEPSEALEAAADGQGQPAQGEAAAASSPTAPAQVAVDESSPLSVVEAYAARWSAGDYDGLYDLLTTEAQLTLGRESFAEQNSGETEGFEELPAQEQQRLAREKFIGRYDGIVTEAGLTSVKVTVTGEPNLETAVPVRVEMESRYVGPIAEENQIQLRKEGDDWKVAWTPSLIFRNLGAGCIDYQADEVKRGAILDRDGDPLAYDGLISRVGVIPGQVGSASDETRMLRELNKLLDMPQEEIKERYQDGEPEWFMPIKDFPEQMDEEILNGIAQLAGVAVRTATARVYPLGEQAAHVTGYISVATAEDLEEDTTGTIQEGTLIGRAGIEASANDLLVGKPGGLLAVVECGTRAVQSEIAERRSEPAKDLTLTIDRELQTAVDKALGDVTGSAVILDPRTGAVLALASHPTYDPNWFVLGFTEKDWAYVNDETKRPLLNRATQASYPTGSIFKVITMAAAMEHLDYTGGTEIDCPSEWSIPGTSQVWRDWTVDEGLAAQGLLTLHDALVASCNTVFYQLGAALDEKGEELLPDMTKAFGLGAPTGIPYFQEIAGTVPDPQWKLDTFGDYWARGDAVNLAIGQGFLEATPLQMAVAYMAIANNGSLIQPYIVELATTPGGSSERIGERTGRSRLPISRENLEEIQSAMRDQTSNSWGAGSVRVFGDFEYPIAGKTGTAQNELNRAGKPHAWFASFGPYDQKATITSIVMVESAGEGVTFAAPRTREIYEAYMRTDLDE